MTDWLLRLRRGWRCAYVAAGRECAVCEHSPLLHRRFWATAPLKADRRRKSMTNAKSRYDDRGERAA
jgi:hypothetical protein